MTKISALTPLGDGLAVGDQFIIRDIDDAGTPNKSVTISGITRGLDRGTNAAPAIAFAADKNTGIYSPGEDQLAVATNGTQKLIVLSNGNVGIGTSSPATQLDVSGNGLIKISNGTQNGWFGATSTTFGFWGSGVNPFPALAIGTTSNHSITIGTNNIGRLIVDTSGNVGIGITDPAYSLDVSTSAAITNNGPQKHLYFRQYTLAQPNAAAIGATDDGNFSHHLQFFTKIPGTNNSALTERARIDSDGRLLVGTTNDAGSSSNRIVVGSNGICGIKKTFTNLDTTPQSFGFQAGNASVYVAHLQSVSTSSVAFLIACVYDTAVGIVMATTALGRCTAGGTAATISGINNDARTYTFQRDAGTGEFTVTASAVATGSTIIALTPLNQFL